MPAEQPRRRRRTTDSPSRRKRVGRPRERAKALVRSTHPPICWLCDLPIDMTADPQRHPLASSVDEIIPVIRGGSTTDPTNLRHAHRVCNNSRGTHALVPWDPEWHHRTKEPEEVRARCRTIAAAHLEPHTPPIRTW